MDIGIRLKEWREYKRLSQSDFAESIGLKQGSYSDIERGRIKGLSSSTIKLITIAYDDLNISWLLTGEGQMLKSKQESFFPEMESSKEQERNVSMIDRLLNIIEGQQGEIREIKSTLKEIESYLYKKNNQE